MASKYWKIQQDERKKELKKFERMKNKAKAKAYSELSLQRPLTDAEFKDYKKIMEKL